MDRDVERQRMQEYLSLEIAEADRLEFQEYLESLKPNGGKDIDLWNYDEIVASVDKYRKGKKNNDAPAPKEKPSFVKEPEITPNQEPPAYLKAKTSEFANKDMRGGSVFNIQPNKNLESDINMKASQFSEYKTIPFEPIKFNAGISKKLKCKQLPRTKLDQEGVTCKILDSETVKGGIFSPNYVVYVIETYPYKWVVKRRYSDFDWLRNTLVRINLGCIVPPLSGKKMGKGLDSQTTLKRKSFLERFLRDILKSPILRNNTIVSDFLEIPDESLFNKKKKDADTIVKPPKPEYALSLTGEVEIAVQEQLGQYLNEVSGFFESSENQYKKVKKLSDQLISDLERVNHTLGDLSDAFLTFEKNASNLNKTLIFGKIPRLPQIYAGMNNICSEMNKSIEDQINLVQQNFCNFFKYNKNMTFSVNEVIKEKNMNFSDCAKMEKKVIAQKEKSQADGIPVKYIDGHASDVVILNNMEEKSGFLSNRMFEEFSRILHYKCESYLEHLSKMSKENIERIKKDENRMRNIGLQVNEVNYRPVFQGMMSSIKKK